MKTMYTANGKSVNIARFLEKFGEEYDFCYENRDNVAGFREAVEAFDAFCKASEHNAAFVREFCAYRDDFISSDREAAAFMFALSALTGGESAEVPAPKKPLKTHKIRGVEKSVCCAEQKIAYNLAFCYLNINDFSIEGALDVWEVSAQAQSGRYNAEAVEAALRAGADAYRAKPFIATRYEEIGAAFPLPV